MKKQLLTLTILLNITLSAFANSANDITAIENSLFGYDYKTENNSKRIERIEKQLYGEKRSGSIEKRLSNIKNDTGYIAEEEIEQLKANQAEETQNTEKVTKENKKKIKEIKEDETVEYPIVDKMEQEIFKTTYKKDNIYDRLTRLEEKIFSKTSTEDLNIRVSNLASVIDPKLLKKNPKDFSTKDIEEFYKAQGYDSVDDNSIPFHLTVLEEGILKNDYSGENISKRLGRLEQKLFKKTYSNDTDIERIQRLMVAFDAQKDNYKYENNKRMQNIAAMSQIGGILLMLLAILL